MEETRSPLIKKRSYFNSDVRHCARGLVGNWTLGGFAGEQQVPAKAAFERAKKRLRHPTKVRLLDVTILHVVRNTIGKDVLDLNFANAEAVIFKKLTSFMASIGVGHRAAGLRF